VKPHIVVLSHSNVVEDEALSHRHLAVRMPAHTDSNKGNVSLRKFFFWVSFVSTPPFFLTYLSTICASSL